MYVVLKKLNDAAEWDITAVVNTDRQAECIQRQYIKDGWQCRFYSALSVYIAKDGNHSWH